MSGVTKNPKNTLISNVTSEEVKEASLLKNLLVKKLLKMKKKEDQKRN